jgi:hypothetical protein
MLDPIFAFSFFFQFVCLPSSRTSFLNKGFFIEKISSRSRRDRFEEKQQMLDELWRIYNGARAIKVPREWL